MKHCLIIISCFLILLGEGCKEKKFEPLVKNDIKPGKISNIQIKNTYGGADISYTLPKAPYLLYVKAVYSINGIRYIVKSSKFKNTILLEGFPDTLKHEVELYAVNTSENSSEAVTVLVHPLKPPVDSIIETLEAHATFGGVNLEFTNKLKKSFVLHTLVKDSLNEWTLYDRLYTSAEDKSYNVRGLAAEPTKFAFYFTDEWQNHSDTLFTELTPLFEKELIKSLWKNMSLDNDTYKSKYSPWAIEHLWDNDLSTFFYVDERISGLKLPNWITIDLGKKYKFSRIRVFGRNDIAKWMFNLAPKEFEIYGSNEPDPDGSWNSWTLLGQYESIKPSGLPLGQVSNEDISVAKAGEDFEFENMNTGYKYIRFKTIETWSGSPAPMIAEITLWGQEDK